VTTGHDHAEAVATVLAAFGKLGRAGIDQADSMGDKDTADLFTEISRGVDKWPWFVESTCRSTGSAAAGGFARRTVISRFGRVNEP
jgi:starvation-inducible DNA-binding protein